jgi:hypothetical protein
MQHDSGQTLFYSQPLLGIQSRCIKSMIWKPLVVFCSGIVLGNCITSFTGLVLPIFCSVYLLASVLLIVQKRNHVFVLLLTIFNSFLLSSSNINLPTAKVINDKQFTSNFSNFSIDINDTRVFRTISFTMVQLVGISKKKLNLREYFIKNKIKIIAD